jgi:SAM-dependent methyltransferase
MMENVDDNTVAGFGDEWSRFDQTGLSSSERDIIFGQYFRVFPWASLPRDAVGMDVGCGSGRWAAVVAPRVGRLLCVDASAEALEVAKGRLRGQPNCEFFHASVAALPVADDTLDFLYSLGVLHHVPDTAAALAACVRKLKPGAPLLVYLYYAFDQRPTWFRILWRASDGARQVVSRMPFALRYAASQVLAAAVYYPLARSARLLARRGIDVENFPLSAYRERSFYVMRTDALDRFGTRLEQRFTRGQITEMMASAGLERIEFSDAVPFWCAVGYRRER